MDLVSIAGIVGGFAGGLVVLAAAVRFVVAPLRQLLRHQEEFRDDWYGRAARPGRPAVPGVPERLARIEDELRNETGSLRLALSHIETRLSDHINQHGGTHT